VDCTVCNAARERLFVALSLHCAGSELLVVLLLGHRLETDFRTVRNCSVALKLAQATFVTHNYSHTYLLQSVCTYECT
jgi:hypothetical protein